MAEFCPECWKKLNGDDGKEYILSYDVDLCEGCGEWKQVIVAERRGSRSGLLRDIIRRILEKRGLK